MLNNRLCNSSCPSPTNKWKLPCPSLGGPSGTSRSVFSGGVPAEYIPLTAVLQIAVSRFFDGDSAATSGNEQVAPSVPAAASTRRSETLLNGSTTFPPRLPSSLRGITPAPRIVPQVNRRPPFIISLLLLPLNFIYRLLARPLGLFSHLFPFLQRLLPSAGLAHRGPARPLATATERRSLSPRDTAARFVRELEEEYGPSPIPFYDNGYAQALDLAKRDLRFLLIILLSPEHDDTSSFIQNTLLSREVVDCITNAENRIIVWAGTVQDSEAYQVSAALNCTKFPFAALIAHTPQVSSSAMSVVARIVGPTPPGAFVAKLQEAINQHSESLDRARTARESREAERSLREEQNSAYQRSLAQDRERARERREAEAARIRAEREQRERAEAQEKRERDLLQWKLWRARQLSAEPDAEDAEASTRVSIRMPSGERILRRFSSEASVEEVYAFVECHDAPRDPAGHASSGPLASGAQKPHGYKHAYQFRLVSPLPRTVYEAEADVMVGACIKNNTNLVVEPLEEDEED